MDFDNIKTHLLDFAKGLLAAMATAAMLSAAQYLGAHLPDLLNLLTPGVVAAAVIKATRNV